jgi:hypothetical protein
VVLPRHHAIVSPGMTRQKLLLTPSVVAGIERETAKTTRATKSSLDHLAKHALGAIAWPRRAADP